MGISSRLRFEHQTVNHSESFVDPTTGAHTQNIESQWNKAKSLIKQHKGVVEDKLELLLAEIMWKNNVGERMGFEAIFELFTIH